jgi:hypothetical protein
VNSNSSFFDDPQRARQFLRSKQFQNARYRSNCRRIRLRCKSKHDYARILIRWISPDIREIKIEANKSPRFFLAAVDDRVVSSAAETLLDN